MRTRNRRRALYAKRKAKLKQSHEMFANFLLENVGSCFFVEKMSTAGLSKRSKKTKTNPKTGRPYSKKRFGKSIANHAPIHVCRYPDPQGPGGGRQRR